MIEIGQKLWYVPARRGEPCEVTVTKIGRKWATVGEGWQEMRINLVAINANGNAAVDGGQYASPGTCYVSREEYGRSRALAQKWDELNSLIRYKYQAPEGVTVADIEQAMKLLRLEPPKCWPSPKRAE